MNLTSFTSIYFSAGLWHVSNTSSAAFQKQNRSRDSLCLSRLGLPDKYQLDASAPEILKVEHNLWNFKFPFSTQHLPAPTPPTSPSTNY